ncbi:WD40-repeat-containing domain protein [Syncephalastrum racemosum]|uniref:WD40-repeat-containing domain protein n=1 Tax=Syncephalastrum racemosum TaxID=13706 RepID=A0A1X2HJ58_SYNRA|nr:WD40-repeat-containing domain protein [Syncephalastrum racemosum]
MTVLQNNIPCTTTKDISSNVDCHFVNVNRWRAHPLKPTVGHWQLRDLLVMTDEENMFLAVGPSIIRYNSRAMRSDYPSLKLTYTPTCLAVGNGYLAVGGSKGQLSLADLQKWQIVEQITSSSLDLINNGLCIQSINGQLKLFVTNNDCLLRIYSLPSLELGQTIEFQGPINTAEVSPDGRRMVVTADSDVVHWFETVTSSSAHFRDIGKIRPSKTSASFSASWNRASDQFATGNQDGTVHVWDIRMRRELAQLTTQKKEGAVRCVKYAQSGCMDLLAFSEQAARVHIVDTRRFEEQQTIRIPEGHPSRGTSGLCFSPEQSRRLFVGIEGAVVNEYDVNTHRRRAFPHAVALF